MADITRVSPAQARERLRSGTALLVCAYDDEELCRRNRLEGALSMKEFTSRLSTLDKNQEIIFYCA